MRFDGYQFARLRGDDRILATLSKRLVATLRMSPDPAENHASFFALQRYLCTWGGEQLPESSRERLAYLLLFLHLYRVEIGPALRNEGCAADWLTHHADRAEGSAA